MFYVSQSYVFEVWRINPGLQNLAKSDSGFEDVSRSFFIDFGSILISSLDPEIDKNRTTKQADFGNDFGREFRRFYDKMRWNRGGPAEGAGLLEA